MIKLILFDIGNVLLNLQWENSLQLLSNLETDSEHLLKRLLNHQTSIDFEKGEITEFDYFNFIKSEIKQIENVEQFKHIWNACISNEIEQIDVLIKKLSNYKVAILSNTNQTHYEYFLKKHAFISTFDKIYTSHLLKCRKPEDIIYKKVISDIYKQFKIEAEEILFIDDLTKNVELARKNGINAEVSFQSIERTKKILDQYEIIY